MTLDQLRYFRAVATYQHVGRAAHAIAISPSVLSAAVSTLEEELGCELFRRKGRGIEITRDGERLLERSKAILGRVDSLRSEMKGEAAPLEGRYRLGASPFLASRLLVDGWARVGARHPGLVADLHSLPTAHAIAEVLSGRMDLAVCFSPLKHPDLAEWALGSGQLVIAVRKGHPVLKKSRKHQLRFLVDAPAFIHKSSQGVDICETHPVFDRLGFQPRICLSWDSDDIAVRALAWGEGWSFLPDIVVRAHQDTLVVLPLPKEAGAAPYVILAIRHRERSPDRVLEELYASLLQAARGPN